MRILASSTFMCRRVCVCVCVCVRVFESASHTCTVLYLSCAQSCVYLCVCVCVITSAAHTCTVLIVCAVIFAEYALLLYVHTCVYHTQTHVYTIRKHVYTIRKHGMCLITITACMHAHIHSQALLCIFEKHASHVLHTFTHLYQSARPKTRHMIQKLSVELLGTPHECFRAWFSVAGL